MLAELLTRFLIGGVAVSLFATVGEVVAPKTFAGLFGAAPSVAIATLALAYGKGGAATVATEARWMALASVAMLAYCACSARLAARERLPVWLAALLAWISWLVVAAVVRTVIEVAA